MFTTNEAVFTIGLNACPLVGFASCEDEMVYQWFRQARQSTAEQLEASALDQYGEDCIDQFAQMLCDSLTTHAASSEEWGMTGDIYRHLLFRALGQVDFRNVAQAFRLRAKVTRFEQARELQELRVA